MGRFAALFQKDVKVIVRNRALLVTLILYPLLMVSILGLVFADPDPPLTVGMVVGSEGNGAVTFSDLQVSLESIEATIDEAARADRYATREDAEEALRNGRVDAILVFPDYFIADLLEVGKQATLTIVLDGSDPSKSSVAQNIILASVHRFNEEVVRYKVELVVELLDVALEGSDQPGTSDMSFRELLDLLRRLRDTEDLSPENRIAVEDAIAFLQAAIIELEQSRTTVESIALPIRPQFENIDSGVLEARDIVVPAAVALSIFWTGILAAGSLVVYERQSHAQARLNVTPVGMGPIITSKLLVTGLIILAQSLVILAVAKGAWDIRIDNVPLLMLTLVIGAFSAVGLGLLVAGFSRDTNGSTLLSVLVIFPMMFLSGLFFPIDFMPRAAQVLAYLMPLTYAVDALRGAMLRGFAFEHARLDLAVLLVLGLVAMAIGFVRNRRLARGQ